MGRAKQPIIVLATLCLVATGCARLGRADQSLATNSPNPATAIALSVLADSIYLVDPSSGLLEPVAQGLANFQAGYAAWSPDHRLLAYGSDGIVVLDPRTGQRRIVVTGPSLSMPTWNGEGTQLAYGSGISLYVSPLSSASPVSIRLPETLAPIGMDWWPGVSIAFEGLQLDCGHAATCFSTDKSDIWTIRPDGTGLHRLTRIGEAESPKWSPDHSRLLFIRRSSGSKTPRSELWVVGSDGSGAHQLFPGSNVIAADWSPDGREIAMVRTGSGPDVLELWTVDASGTDARLLSQEIPGTDATVDW
jgi:TolB protein